MGQKINTAAAKGFPVVLEEVTVRLTPAQMQALFTTAQTLVRARAAEVIIPFSVMVYKPAGTAYAGIAAGEDLSIEDANAVNFITIETTGFLDQTTEQYRYGEKAVQANKATGKGVNIRAKLLVGDITTGTSPIWITMAFYRVELGRVPTVGD